LQLRDPFLSRFFLDNYSRGVPGSKEHESSRFNLKTAALFKHAQSIQFYYCPQPFIAVRKRTIFMLIFYLTIEFARNSF